MRVLHLVGSPVSDFYADLSRLYARGCLEVTAGLHDVHIAVVSPDGRWRFPATLDAPAPALDFSGAMAHLAALEVDVMVPQLFCLPGMTHYRALFDVLGIPYVGNAPAVMALTADKARAKAVVAGAGVAVPAGEVVRRGERPTIAPPAVVKPVDADNSHGVTLVLKHEAYAAALPAAFEHSGAALVETYVELGREVRCGIVVQDGALVCLPLEEYAVDGVRAAGDKLARDGDGELHLVAKERTKAWIVDPADPVTAAVWDAAKRCHVALGCRDYSLFDFRVDPAGRPHFLEAGLYCSFAEQSVIATMARAAGLPTRALFERAVHTAAERARSDCPHRQAYSGSGVST